MLKFALAICAVFAFVLLSTSAAGRGEGGNCSIDGQCSSELTCKDGKCTNPCYDNKCAANTDCTSVNHRAICTCKKGYEGHPTTACSRKESCTYNADCDTNLACRHGSCVDPCANECTGKKCNVISHVAQCN